MGGIVYPTGPADGSKALRELGDHGDIEFYREMSQFRAMQAHLKMLDEIVELMQPKEPSEHVKREFLYDTPCNLGEPHTVYRTTYEDGSSQLEMLPSETLKEEAST